MAHRADNDQMMWESKSAQERNAPFKAHAGSSSDVFPKDLGGKWDLSSLKVCSLSVKCCLLTVSFLQTVSDVLATEVTADDVQMVWDSQSKAINVPGKDIGSFTDVISKESGGKFSLSCKRGQIGLSKSLRAQYFESL